MATGHVKWFNANKGYGFIQTSEGVDHFVHFKAIADAGENGFKTLKDGEKVEFTPKKGVKGMEAVSVKVIY